VPGATIIFGDNRHLGIIIRFLSALGLLFVLITAVRGGSLLEFYKIINVRVRFKIAQSMYKFFTKQDY
jgi:hypothetical protein